MRFGSASSTFQDLRLARFSNIHEKNLWYRVLPGELTMETSVPDYNMDGLLRKLENVLSKRDQESLGSADGQRCIAQLLSLLAEPTEAVVCHQNPPPHAFGCHFECLCCSSLKDPEKRPAFRNVRSVLSHFKTGRHKANVQGLDPAALALAKAQVHQCEYLCSSNHCFLTLN
jgi:hypothetical protein